MSLSTELANICELHVLGGNLETEGSEEPVGKIGPVV